ncbi:MAG TPA: hypothetical protein VKU19_28170 [Bryobacteraceae bacterium]|nr:hypothetical protein [Bryobacteraceae bacterium]
MLLAITVSALCLASCPRPAPTPAQEAADFAALLQKGDYAGAIAFTETSAMASRDKDGVIGTLILDGLVDHGATTRPKASLADGFDRMERAAAAGRSQSVADLRAKFTTGVNDAGKNSLMAPLPALAKCWTDVEQGSEKAGSCIQMRQKLRVP